MDIRTLCHRCADDYRMAGYVLNRTNNIKTPCDICKRMGYDYQVMSGGERGKCKLDKNQK